jgi:hypothetical protein
MIGLSVPPSALAVQRAPPGSRVARRCSSNGKTFEPLRMDQERTDCSALPDKNRKGFPMRVNKMIAAATLPAMMTSPASAANPAASLSLRGDTGGSSTSADDSAASQAQAAAYPAAAGGISSGLLIGGLAIIVIVVGAVALGSGHHSHSTMPASA